MRGGAARHRTAWADVSSPPPLGRLGSTFAGQHSFASETELKDDLRSLVRIGRIVGREERGYDARVIGVSRQEIPWIEIPWTQPLAPGHPRRCQQRVRTGQQHHLVHGDGPRAPRSSHSHRPEPARVAGDVRVENVRNQTVPFGMYGLLRANRLATNVDGRL